MYRYSYGNFCVQQEYPLPRATRLGVRPNRGKPPLELYIPACIRTPVHPLHPPPIDKPLRIQIEGPAVAIERLLPDTPWALGHWCQEFPQPPGPELAKLTYRMLYGREPILEGDSVSEGSARDMVVRDEYLGVVTSARPSFELDYYGVTFDHLVPIDDFDPEVLQINIIEIEIDNGKYFNTFMPFPVNVADYAGKKVLAIPRCCSKRKGTTDRARVNESIAYRERMIESPVPTEEERQRLFTKSGGGAMA
ncbi:hypothetical protein ACRALDRAFT_1079423 [Sodiomyces alcalophilus JCM 7366]|uniref:uncharacterized protein n=1 Tax=Sodiomyces alcalophilus JCM 7366 TaxID=591952 RepID=UPI0039B4A33A